MYRENTKHIIKHGSKLVPSPRVIPIEFQEGKAAQPGPQHSQNSLPDQQRRILDQLDQLWIPPSTRARIVPALGIPKIPSLTRKGCSGIISSTTFSPPTLGNPWGRGSHGSENVGLTPAPHSRQPSAAPAGIHPSLPALPAPRLRSAPGRGSPGRRRGSGGVIWLIEV